MQAIILATGETRKLQPLTEFIPSPMVPLANRPLMSYAIECLARFGIKNILVSLFHSAALIESYFGDGSRWGVKLDYVLQKEPWGTAGALHWAKNALQKSFLVMPADSILEVNLDAVVDFHRAQGNIGTVVFQEINHNQNRKSHYIDEGFSPPPAENPIAETNDDIGVYVFEPDVLDYIPARRKIEIGEHLLPTLTAAGYSLAKFKTCGYWNALGTFERYLDAQQHYLTQDQDKSKDSVDYSMFSNIYSSRSEQITEGVWVGKNSTIHPSTEIISPVRIGENSRIGPDVELGPNSVVGANVVIDAGATVRESTLLDNTYVGQLVNIEKRLVYKRLVIDLQTAESIEIPDQLLVGQTYNAISDSSLRRFADLVFAGTCVFFVFPLALILGVFTFLSAGRFFEQVPALGTRIKPTGQYSPEKEHSFNLLRFPILNKQGKSTSFGQQIKRLDWHRIPELWNVIKGDMSFVGVMPLSPDDQTHIEEPWQKSRNVCFPGFTGLWYSMDADTGNLDEILITDAYYAATRKWQGDIKLVWMTCLTWLRKVRALFG